MSVAVGIIGQKGSGKGTLVEFLEKIVCDKKLQRVGSSDILAETLLLWDIKKTRSNLQDLAIIMDGHFGIGSLTKAVEKIMRASKADVVVFDGMRWQSDVDMIRRFPKNILIYVSADINNRYTRTKARKEKVGESLAPFEQFVQEEQKKTETDIVRLGALADVHINNDGSIENYFNDVKNIYEKSIKNLL